MASFGKQVPRQRIADPADIAAAYLVLADPLSINLSGATIAVVGGGRI